MAMRTTLHLSPARILLSSLLCAITIGSLLLALPIAHSTSISLLDIIFTATSVTTVTGLATIPLEYFTQFGKVVILILMQIGGIGLITMTLFTLSFFMELRYATQLMAGKMLELESWKNVKKLLVFIISFTLICEILGAILIFVSIYGKYSFWNTLFFSLFHSVASFCETGFSIFPHKIINFQQNGTFLMTTAALILSGGLGFITWIEIISYARSFHKKRRHLSLHSKIVLYMTLLLTLSASILFFALEYNNTLSHLTPLYTIINAFFNAVTCRGCGLVSVIPSHLSLASLFLITIIAFIGASPGSTGSGVKTTTFAICLATIRAALWGRTSVELRGRRILKEQVYKATAIVFLALSWVAVITFFLLVTEKNWHFLDVFFEVVSAFSTLGVSTGLTPYLSSIGKICIIITMIIGRIGALTILLVFGIKQEKAEFSYPEERIMLG